MSAADTTDRSAHGRLDFLSGAVFLVLSLGALAWAIPAFVETPENTTQMSARFFPDLAAAVVAVCSAALMVANRHAVRLPTGGRGALILGEALVWTLCAVATMAGLVWLGFVPTGIALIVLATVAARYRGNWLLALALAVAIPVAVDQLVWHVFLIDLP